MRSLIEFLKTTLLGGLFILLPLVLVYLALAEVVDLMVVLATPVADLVFPAGTFDEVEYIPAIATVLLLGASFVLGLLAKAAWGRAIGHSVERAVLLRLPMYRAIKALTSSLGDTEDSAAFQPALLRSSDGVGEIVYLVEDHGDGRSTVMVPWTPTPMAGSIKIVPTDRLELLDASLGDVTRVLSQWGVGARELLSQPEG